MFDLQRSPFDVPNVRIDPDAEVVFVADMFASDYCGGAELTTEALLDSSPLRLSRIHSKDVTPQLLQEHGHRHWVLGNFSQLNPQVLLLLASRQGPRYSIIEYDYKYCMWRSPERHMHEAGTPCDCVARLGHVYGPLFANASSLWWMSQKQLDRYVTAFPQLSQRGNTVLSSVFSTATLQRLRGLRNNADPSARYGWIVLGSSSWVKGANAARQWCERTGKPHRLVWDVPYDQLLEELSRAEGFACTPNGGDTCPRMVIEAKLLGCQLHLNDNVQHASEAWFDTDDLDSIESYLTSAPQRFWDGIKADITRRPTISGYVTAYNCVKQGYPLKQCVSSMLRFCDEVCIVDGGSTDGTLDELIFMAYPKAFEPAYDGRLGRAAHEQICFLEDVRILIALSKLDGTRYDLPDELFGIKRDPRIKVSIILRDWSDKRHPVFDGLQKAEARRMCTREFCWQMDADEVVHEDDAAKVIDLCDRIPLGVDIIALPVIEYWGGPDKVRMDIQAWKWRLSRNLPHITHGIPRELRREDADGLYAAPGTDGCDMVDATTFERLPFAGFWSEGAERTRLAAMAGNEGARSQFEGWFNQVVNELPSVFHYSWYDIRKKVMLYRDYWQNHWNALWNRDTSDTAENNMMFDVAWSQVTDDMIADRAELMRTLLGGWVWHRKWDGKSRTPHVTCHRSQPKEMLQ